MKTAYSVCNCYLALLHFGLGTGSRECCPLGQRENPALTVDRGPTVHRQRSGMKLAWTPGCAGSSSFSR